ncbi:N-acetylgalactosaminyltransferase 4-like [Physella acuta]|uniref:N-acetylgalactosaminyltransferase 4-like n=1 Tax=Physella acuta TaxID=109671 RepID=UPI0027DB7A53|nr:N-acetylgalactosaminyltransferase 4-like [Physella acuta]
MPFRMKKYMLLMLTLFLNFLILYLVVFVEDSEQMPSAVLNSDQNNQPPESRVYPHQDVIITPTVPYIRQAKQRKTLRIQGTESQIHPIKGGNISSGVKSRYRDWNDYMLMLKERGRKGFGEGGRGVNASVLDDHNQQSELTKLYMYNARLSDVISVKRSLEDARSDVCKKQKFLADIPRNSVSIISVFYNERLSTVLRTVHSVMSRSPAILIRELVLVDDASSDVELKKPLDDYVSQHFPKVKILRLRQRSGLIRARMYGADVTTGSFLVFLDSHVEVNYNYLPPLLEPMLVNYKTIVCPIVDSIDPETFQVKAQKVRTRGGFNWRMQYKSIPSSEAVGTSPLATPVMVGCAFAITRKWWEELGQYDPGLQIWGGENFEMSFKTWMCGGRLVDAPCSRVAHLFRPLPYFQDLYADDIIEKNFLRVASVWMDEYKQAVMRARNIKSSLDPGDLTQQHDVRHRLRCKSFNWYMHKVAPDVLRHYPANPPPSLAVGDIRLAWNSQCINSTGTYLTLSNCSSLTVHEFDWRARIQGVTLQCFTNSKNDVIDMRPCVDIEEKPTQRFAWNPTTGQIASFNTRLCLQYDTGTNTVHMNRCDATLITQLWVLDSVNITAAESVWSRYEKDENPYDIF